MFCISGIIVLYRARPNVTDNELDWLLNVCPKFGTIPDKDNYNASEEKEEIITQSDHDSDFEQEYESDSDFSPEIQRTAC